MSDVDVALIVPSMRDLFAAVATRRSSLALVPLVDGPEIAHEVGRLDQLGVGAIALAEPGDDMRLAARSTLATPTLSLAIARSAADCQRARFHGADGLCIDAEDERTWTTLSKTATSMRMMPIGRATNAEELGRVAGFGARAVLLCVHDAQAAVRSAEHAALTTVVLASLDSADGDELRALRGQVDAAVVPPSLHRAEGFAALLAELDT